MTDIQLNLVGMNNRTAPESVPSGKARNAVNVQFDNAGKILFPRQGKTELYAGTGIHSVHNGVNILFVESGTLKKRSSDGVVTTLQANIGDTPVWYTTAGDTTYWTNAVTRGRVKDGQPLPWGITPPDHQPDAAGIHFGGMDAGTYQYAVSWLRGYEESGMTMCVSVEVPEGGGIRFYNFPTPPSDATGLSIYISPVHGAELFRYGDYPANVSQIDAAKKVCTIIQRTQYKYPPLPTGKIIYHGGRIYYKDGALIRFTDPQTYGLESVGNYWAFDGTEIRTILSNPPNMYVNTQKRLYKVTNIDAPDSPPTQTVLQTGGAVTGSECTDPDGVTCYYMSDRGIILTRAEEFQLLSYDDVAIPFYDSGSMAVTERDGLKYLIFVGRGGIQNPMANKAYSAAELLRNSL